MSEIKSVEEIVDTLACVWNYGVTFNSKELVSYKSKASIENMGARKRHESTLGYFVEYAHSGNELLRKFNSFASRYNEDIYFIQFPDTPVKDYWTGLCYSFKEDVQKIVETLVKHLQIDSFRTKFVNALNERVEHNMGIITSHRQTLMKIDAHVVEIIMNKINEEENDMSKGVIKELMNIEKGLVESWKYYVTFGLTWSHNTLIADMGEYSDNDHKLKLIDELCGTFVGKWTENLKPLVADLTDTVLVKYNPEDDIVDVYGFSDNQSIIDLFETLKVVVFNQIVVKHLVTIVNNIVVKEDVDKNAFTNIPGTNSKLYRLSTTGLQHMIKLATDLANDDNSRWFNGMGGNTAQSLQLQWNRFGDRSMPKDVNVYCSDKPNPWPKAPESFNATTPNGFIRGNFPTQGWPNNVQSPFASNITPIIPQTGKVQCAVFKSRKDDTSVPEGMIQFLNRGELLDIHIHENYEYIYRTVTIRVK